MDTAKINERLEFIEGSISSLIIMLRNKTLRLKIWQLRFSLKTHVSNLKQDVKTEVKNLDKRMKENASSLEALKRNFSTKRHKRG